MTEMQDITRLARRKAREHSEDPSVLIDLVDVLAGLLEGMEDLDRRTMARIDQFREEAAR